MLSQEAQQAWVFQLARELHLEIRHWLLAMELFADPYRAAARPSTEAGCAARDASHRLQVQPLPLRPGRPDRVMCTVQQRALPDAVLQAHVLRLLKQEGFTIAGPLSNSCGCATFTVQPRRLAG